MRIRTQLLLSTLAAALVAGCVIGGLLLVTHQSSEGLAEQAEAEQVARDVANMLSLTNELAVYGSDRAIAQWRARYIQLNSAVRTAAARRNPPSTAMIDLQRAIDDLPAIFDAIAGLSQQPQSPLAARRRELLFERLLIETQAIVERRHRWALEIAEAREREQHLYTTMVLAAPAALMALLLGLLLLLGLRVLAPLARMEAAVRAIQGGDLDVRCDSRSKDELGEAARAVDAMAQALQQQSTALKASEQHLRLVADNLPALIGHLDAEQRFTFVNARVGRVLHRSPQMLIGLTLAEVADPQIMRDWAPYVAQVLGGESVTFASQGLTRGQMRYYRLSFVPDLDEAGQVQGFYAVSFDITAMKEAELRQAASERFLSDITDNMPALVAYVDADRHYRFANAKYGDWLGRDPSTMIGLTVAEALGPDVNASVSPTLDRALAGERTQHTWACPNGDGTYYLHSDYIPDLADDGTVRGCYALTIDVTARREAEHQLAQSEQRLVDVTNNLPAVVGYFDMDQRCQYANEPALTSQGLGRDDVVGMTLRGFLGEVLYAQHERYVQEALKGRRARLDGKIEFPGRAAHFQAHLVPDRVEGGAQRGFYLMSFDITALKEAQHQQARIERQLRTITDNVPALIAYVDSEERYTYANHLFRSWFGIDPERLQGIKVSDAMTPVLYEQRRAALKTALSGRRVEFDIESELGGVLRQLHGVYVPDVRQDGSVAGIFALSFDVSSVRRTTPPAMAGAGSA